MNDNPTHHNNHLPIRKFAKEIIDSVLQNPVTVIIGEAGSGKTTQIAQILLEAGLADGAAIAITQPRRVAAISVARRVAQEQNVTLGAEVGYTVRFEDCSSHKTKIKYLTDGTLLRELIDCPTLEDRYSIVVLDEAHERSLNTDILFGILKQLVFAPLKSNNKSSPTSLHRDFCRSDQKTLKLVITSATLESQKFSSYFNNCPVFHIPGRVYPVQIIHSMESHSNDYEAAAIDTVMDIHMHQPPGDILLFLTGQAEIDRTVHALNEAVAALPIDSCGDLHVLPLYAALPLEMQSRVFATRSTAAPRRCIVATNIAETSVTVDGVVYVIDSGMVKQKQYNPRTGMDTLRTIQISRVQAMQRAGRAGRTQPGTCYRLYTKKMFDHEMLEMTPPEIQRISLLHAVLYLKSLGQLHIDVLGFDFIDKPSRESIEDALRQLYIIDAIDNAGILTKRGRSMAALPLDPCLSGALVHAYELGCFDDALIVVSMLSIEGNKLFLKGKGVHYYNHDHNYEHRHGTITVQSSLNNNDNNTDTYNHDDMTRRQWTAKNVDGDNDGDMLASCMKDGLGDHIFLLKLYKEWKKQEERGLSTQWCKEWHIDDRSMRFARDVRNQLDGCFIQSITKNELKKTSSAHYNSSSKSKRSSRNEPKKEEKKIYFSFYCLRKAFALGCAPRLAQRLPKYNGYKTVGSITPILAQIHPSSCVLTTDDEGLYPEWVVYSELISTGKAVYLSGVCCVDKSWVVQILPKLQQMDILRLSGGDSSKSNSGVGAPHIGSCVDEKNDNNNNGTMHDDTNNKNDRRDAIVAAKTRFLARKKERMYNRDSQ